MLASDGDAYFTGVGGFPVEDAQQGVEMDAQGRVYVVYDPGLDDPVVRRYTRSGQLLGETSLGSEGQTMKYWTVGPDGTIYFTTYDFATSNPNDFEPGLLYRVSQGGTPVQFGDVSGFLDGVIATKDLIYVADGAQNSQELHVAVLNKAGTVVEGWDYARNAAPVSWAPIPGTNDIYTTVEAPHPSDPTTWNDYRVLRQSRDGAITSSWGHGSKHGGQFECPINSIAQAAGRIWTAGGYPGVCDMPAKVFTPAGTLVDRVYTLAISDLASDGTHVVAATYSNDIIELGEFDPPPAQIQAPGSAKCKAKRGKAPSRCLIGFGCSNTAPGPQSCQGSIALWTKDKSKRLKGRVPATGKPARKKKLLLATATFNLPAESGDGVLFKFTRKGKKLIKLALTGKRRASKLKAEALLGDESLGTLKISFK